ncbi:hypothetical protein NP233_g7408 [Leucocoprinus birnbaumii]|uniref:Uncharacterized protein n=1 Tax=Leucocoprinus birnbaumii TaxID=56174 RepID=A0AAD5VPE8_9AGAR|nr:hypothetical protein NP233_g7408 [Leucocoprinus birnbaumii]
MILLRLRLLRTPIPKDEYGIPLSPTWSVTKLLSSYPEPSISPQTLNRLHELAALVPPAEGTPEHETLRKEISELVRLVEAVKLVDTQGVSVSARWDKEDADKLNAEVIPDDLSNKGERLDLLLRHAARTQDGYYIVDADRKRNVS